VCNNTCAEIGRAHREQTEKAAKLRKTGGKIRNTYIAFAQKEKTRLAALVSEAEAEIGTREREVARLKDIAARTESISAAALEHRKLSRGSFRPRPLVPAT
jgi:protein kinase C substrate 80K-H